MKKFKLTFTAIVLFIIFIYFIQIFRNYNVSRELKLEERNRIQQSAEILNGCFDLKNKSKRSTNESMKLIEYCLGKYGTKNRSN